MKLLFLPLQHHRCSPLWWTGQVHTHKDNGIQHLHVFRKRAEAIVKAMIAVSFSSGVLKIAMKYECRFWGSHDLLNNQVHCHFALLQSGNITPTYEIFINTQLSFLELMKIAEKQQGLLFQCLKFLWLSCPRFYCQTAGTAQHSGTVQETVTLHIRFSMG